MDYKEVAAQFCKYYYSVYGINYEAMKSLYKNNALITYNGIEIMGADNFLPKLKNEINQFTTRHTLLKYLAQPLNNSYLITGIVEKYNNGVTSTYTETFILEKIGSKMFIANNIIQF